MKGFGKILTVIFFSVVSAGSVMSANNDETVHYNYHQYSIEQGLTHQTVTCIASNGEGILWVGTDMGLNVIINGSINNYVNYWTEQGSYQIGRIKSIVAVPGFPKVLINTENGLLQQTIGSTLFDRIVYAGNYIYSSAIGAWNGSAYIVSTIDGRIVLLSLNLENSNIDKVADLGAEGEYDFTRIMNVKGDESAIILGDDHRGVFRFDNKTRQLTHFGHMPTEINSNALFQDMYGTLWVAQYNNGIVGYKPSNDYQWYKSFLLDSFFSRNVMGITETDDAHLCLATNGGGVVVIDRQNDMLTLADNPTVMKGNVIFNLGNSILLGTPHYGLVQISCDDINVYSYSSINNGTRLSHNIVTAFYQDNDCVWLGTAGGGINKFDCRDRSITTYPQTAGMQVSSIAEFNSEYLIFFSLYDNFYLMNKKTGEVEKSPYRITHKFDALSSGYKDVLLSNTKSGNIYTVNCDGKNFHYNIKTKAITEFELKNAKNDDVVVSVLPIEYGVLLVTAYSIYELVDNVSVPKLLYSGDERISSSSIDGNSNIWFVTNRGLYMYDHLFNELMLVLKSDQEELFSAVLFDKSHDIIWVTTSNNRIFAYNQNTKTKHYYSQDDGLYVSTNYYCNTFAAADGTLFFPGSNGLTVITPTKNTQPHRISRPINVLSVQINSKDRIVVPKDNYCKLPSRFESAVIQLGIRNSNPLAGVDLNLIVKKRNNTVYEEKTSKPFFKFNIFKSGNYTVYYQTFVSTGWTVPVELLKIKIPKSFTFYAVSLLLVLMIITVVAAIVIPVRVRRKEKSLEEKLNIKRKSDATNYHWLSELMSGLLHVNITFYANIEMALKSVCESGNMTGKQEQDLNNLRRYVKRSQLYLELMHQANNHDALQSPLNVSTVNFEEWLDNIADDFSLRAKAKGLDFKLVHDAIVGDINIDAERLEVLLRIYLDNALTYSNKGTIVVVTSFSSLGNVKISVIDEGVGIKCDPDLLFIPFTREHQNVPGAGLSLHTVKYMIERMGGRVGAYNNQNAGATFFMSIPVNLVNTAEESSNGLPSDEKDSVPESENKPATDSIDETDSAEFVEGNHEEDPFIDQYATIVPDTEFNTLGYTLLIVDDQQDNLDFLVEEYSDLFKTVYVAHDGVEGLEIAHKHFPNIIVSDVMMPRMNGFDMCKSIKSDLEISHLPVVLLTSKSDSTFQEVGYKLGADAFVPKPFDTRMLYNILKAQLRNRFEIKRQYAVTGMLEITEDYTFSIADEKFMQKLNQYINENISNPDLNVDMLIDHMCVSRSTLFNKMRSLCGVTSNKYIRKVRIERAKEYLAKTDKSMFSIAIEVGFTESQYFSTVFKQETGVTPSQYRSNFIANEKTDSE